MPIYQSCVDQNLTVGNIAALFDNNKEWPGVIITANDNFMGMLSRQRCFEVLGRPFGIEIFSKKTILEFYRSYGCANLLLDADTSIQDAVKSALNRERSMLYDPIIVRIGTNQYGLVNMHVLLLAQCDLLENLYTEMQQLSVRDPLTNLNNRRGFFEAAEPEIVSSQTNHTDLSALMIDIDNFKITNDVYGHFVGDQVLRAVADECQKALRQTDLLGRFGGEEFIALLPNTPIDTAAVIAERLRQKIENLVVYVNGFEVSVTISLGVCHFKDAHRSLDNLLTLADQAMYGAKAAGRNQVMVWDHNLAYMMRKEIGKKELPENYTGIWAKNFRIDAARIYDETIEGWAKALEMRDKETEGHAQRVVNMTLELARRTGFNDMDLVEIRRGALLHDIGKIAIPDPILFKPGPLTDEEWEVMRKHPIYAFELLSPITYLQKSMDIPYCHHEHWDGTGYPRGLRGEEIPLTARIFTIVDVWDALCTQRCYRDAWKPEDVRNFIVEQSGKLLDPNITPVFLKMLDESSDSIEKNLLDVAFSNQIPQ
ncbi:MAG: diguanylate cyclase [Anaerolineaceae bacterium]|nr:diguanylate cyclase [Anaerolineaceae bacterium]